MILTTCISTQLPLNGLQQRKRGTDLCPQLASSRGECLLGLDADFAFEAEKLFCMENWRQRILQAWADQTDPMVPADIISVSPHPSNLEPGVAGHVIVQQHVLDTHAAALVTIVDPAVNHGLFHRQVHVLEDRSRPEDVLFFTGYHMDCPRVAECQVRLRDVLLPPQTPIPIRDGDAFEVSILRTFLPANWIPPTIPRFIEQDEVAFFQVSAVQHRLAAIETDNLKTGQVADSHALAPRKCSFTDEFVQAVRRLSEAQDQDPLPMLDSVDDSTLPPALREIVGTEAN